MLLDTVNDLQQQLQAARQENERLSQRLSDLAAQKTLASDVGETLIKARSSPARLLRFPGYLLRAQKRFLSGEFKPRYADSDLISIMGRQLPGTENAVLFMATNGVGLGHLTRCLSVARQLKKSIDPGRIVFLTTCPALHLIKNEGFIPFYVPSKELFAGQVGSGHWDTLLAREFNAVFSLYDIRTVVFDGAVPLQSLIGVFEQKAGLRKIWIKRGNEKPGHEQERLPYEALFDAIFLPGELGEPAAPRDEKHIPVEPILYLPPGELMSRREARNALGVPQEGLLVYVQLGAGAINDITDETQICFSQLTAEPDVTVVYGQSPLGAPLPVREGVRVIRDYPNMKYFPAFDFAVSACGYNSFHELMACRVPTIFLPNEKAVTDDQVARAKKAERFGCGVCLTQRSEALLRETLADFSARARAGTLAEQLLDIPPCGGANQTAQQLADWVDGS